MNKNLRAKTIAGAGLTSILLGAVLAFAPSAGANPQFNEDDFDAHLHHDHHGVVASGFSTQTKACGSWSADGSQTGWHFILPANENFTELWVAFDSDNNGSADDVRGPLTPGVGFENDPDNSHAYVFTATDATLVDAVANTDGERTEFNLSHVCVPDTDTDTSSSVVDDETTTTEGDTTTTAEETTTTEEATTTTEEATTTTEEATTTTEEATTTTEEATTTSVVEVIDDETTTSEGDVIDDATTTSEFQTRVLQEATTTGPEVLQNTVSRLPATGNEPFDLATVGTALMILGAILVGGSRRTLRTTD